MRLLCLALAIVMAPASPASTPDDALELARAALAGKFGVAPASVSITSVEPDSGAGCGSSAGTRREAVSGRRVLARVADKVYVVHVAAGKAEICGSGLSLAAQPAATEKHTAAVEPDDAASRALVARARTDLARRLGMAEADITFGAFKSVVWPDSGFGCPRPGMEHIQVPRDGVLIRFEAGGRTFDYHGGEGREPFLCEKK